jgi:hypothetical protein
MSIKENIIALSAWSMILIIAYNLDVEIFWMLMLLTGFGAYLLFIHGDN